MLGVPKGSVQQPASARSERGVRFVGADSRLPAIDFRGSNTSRNATSNSLSYPRFTVADDMPAFSPR